MWKRSLRARLTLYVVIPVMLALLAVGSIGFYSAYNEAQEIYDSELSHVANLMLSLLSAEDEEEAKQGHAQDDSLQEKADIVEFGNDFEDSGASHDRRLAFRIWRNGKLLFYSKRTEGFGEMRVIAGFSDQEIENQSWRFYVLPDAHNGYTLEVAQKENARSMLITKVLSTIFSPLILLIPIILILVWIGLKVGLKPLLAISDAVKRRSSLDLTPLSMTQPISEITPLIDSINGLLANLDYALVKERRFTDFAAHELRTPIAIFKTQAQTAMRATDDVQRKTILEAQVQAADRATKMVDQLLTFARLEHTDIPTYALSLGSVVEDMVNERLLLAQQKNITLHFVQEATASIHGNKELFSIIISNLIDNAIKYSPTGGEVAVKITAENQSAIVSVSDNGAGIPEEKISLVTERFYRVSRNQQSGAGLGLSIVKRAAAIMGAKLTIRNKASGSGLEVLLEFAGATFAS